MDEQRKPWDKLPDEPGLWFDRFTAYRLLGPRRHIEEAWRAEETAAAARRIATGKEAKVSKSQQKKSDALKRPPAAWYSAAKDWKWSDRASEWDAHQRSIEEDELLEARRRWTKEKVELKDAIVAKLRRMLLFPLERKTSDVTETIDPDTGITKQHITIIEPAGWRLRDIANLARIADQLMRAEGDTTPPHDVLDEAIERELERLGAARERAASGTAQGGNPA